MDNLQCEKVIFKNTKFYEGGGLKSREGKRQKIIINSLVFRPDILDSDFVIDVGRYANEEGNIEIKEYGIIKDIRFENHKNGNGIIFFIGLNQDLEKADFRNMVLDKVSFQNCNLEKCYFLNAKIDKTEFRNCEFPLEEDAQDIRKGFFAYLPYIFLLLPTTIIVVIIISFILNIFLNLESYILLLSIFAIGFFSWARKQPAYKIKHISIADEKEIYNKENNDEKQLKKILSLLGISYQQLKEKKQLEEDLSSLVISYQQLKENFSKTDFQKSGDFFFAQRFIETFSDKKINNHHSKNFIFLLHYIVNGFGERFFRPLVLFFLTIIAFSFFYTVNEDFISTDSTPIYLLDRNISKISNKNIYKLQYFETNKNSNKSVVYKKYIDIDLNTSTNTNLNILYSDSQFILPTVSKKALDENIVHRKYISIDLNDSINVKLLYSASQFISPIVSKNRTWFKTNTPRGSFWNSIETILLLFFFGAFLLALKNRIRRQ